MGHNSSPYDYVIHVALIARLGASLIKLTSFQLPLIAHIQNGRQFHVTAYYSNRVVIGHFTCQTATSLGRASLVRATNQGSPCTRPRVFLLAFLETNPCPTLYPTLCFWKQLRGRGILRSQASTAAIVACSTNNASTEKRYSYCKRR